MPYRIIKKVKKAANMVPVHNEYSKNFGVDLDDNKTWQYYPLSRSKPRLYGKVSQVLDINGNRLYEVNEEFEFEVYCSQVYGGKNEIIETRFLYLPADFVRGYGIDEGMFVDLCLYAAIVEMYGETNRTFLYPRITCTGPLDVQPKNDENGVKGASESLPNSEKEDRVTLKAKLRKSDVQRKNMMSSFVMQVRTKNRL